jgi:hypothetical protein
MARRALSLKQPWAALAVAGLKTVEVRKWATAHRGPLLIHAARIDDRRPEAWAHVPEEVKPMTRLHGGVIGEAELVECRHYATLETFLADSARHLNDPSWYDEAGLYGFVLRGARPLLFVRAKGNVRMFGVEMDAVVAPPAGVMGRLDRLERSLRREA